MPRLPSGQASVPWHAATVRVVLLSTALVPLSVALVSPGLPVFRDAFGLTDSQASLLLSTVLAPGIVLSPFIGLLTDRVGRRRVLVASLLLWSLAGAAITLRPPFFGVLALRAGQGTGLAGIGVTTVTLIGDAYEDVQRNAVLGANTAALSAGAALYPLLGGALVLVAWNAPFVLYLLGVPAALFASRTLEEPHGEREPRRLVYVQRVVAALSAREAAVLYGAALVIDLLLFGAVFTAIPFLLEGSYGLSPVLIGLVVTTEAVGSTAAATQNARLARVLSDEEIITVGFLSTGLGFVGAWTAATPLLVTAATFVFGAGWGVTLPSIDAGISDLVPTQFRGGALSLRGSASFLGRASGPVVFTAFSAQLGYRTLLLVAGAGALSFAAGSFALSR